MNPITIDTILEKAKQLAVQYYQLTSKPLGITSEYGECLASKLLNLELADARTPGYDAIDGQGRRIQIKSCVLQDVKRVSRRTGSIKITHDWDVLMLVIIDKHFEPYAIYEAKREEVMSALTKTDSKARARGMLSISQVKAIGTRVWPSQPLDVAG